VDTKLEPAQKQQQYGIVRVDSAGRRWYTQRFKSEIVAQCLQPGASVSRISIEHGLNTNLVRKWVQRVRAEGPDIPKLMPVIVSQSDASVATRSSSIAIEIRVGSALIGIGTEAPAHQIEAIVRALR